MILDKIYAEKKRQLERDKERVPLEKLVRLARCKSKSDRFSTALLSHGDIGLIGEVKKASPSKGIIKDDFDSNKIVEQYHQSGVNALSILTETRYFLGSKAYLPMAKTRTDKPLLRKDFILDCYQVLESQILGADALLLIVAGLEQKKLVELIHLTEDLGMEALVEVHQEEELDRALDAGARLVGINNRNLNTFEVDINTTGRLMKRMPKGIVVVSESGIKDHSHMLYLQNHGVRGVLIGESFMRASSITDHEKMLRGES